MADLGSLVVRLALVGGSEFREDMKRASSSVEAFQRSAADFAEQARASFGGQVLETMVRFGAEAVTSFLEAEKATLRLEGALTRAAGQMPGFASGLGAVADGMERATGVDGDYIKSLQQLALQFQVAPALVSRATKAALDWAEATGGSAKQGLQLLTTANAENLQQLQRWGLRVSEADMETRGLVAVLEEAERVYGGASEQMHAASKAIAENKAAWGDLKEAIGETLTGMLHFTGASKASIGTMEALTELFSSKKAEEVEAYRQRVEALNAARNKEVRLTEGLAEARAELDALKGTAFYEAQLAVVAQLEQQLLATEKARKQALGFSNTAPTMRFGDEEALDVESDLPKKMRLAAETARKANAEVLKATLAELNDTIDALGNITVDVGSVKVDLALPSAAREFADGTSAAMEALSAQMKKTALEQAAAFARAAAESQERATAAWREIGGRALSALGNAGGMIERAVSAGLAGGPMAALASVFVDILTQSATFQRIVATLNGIIQSVADALGQLLEPLLPLVGAVGLVITALMPLASTLIEFVVSAVEPLTPVLVLVSTVLQGLMPVLTILRQAFLMIINPLMVIAGPVLHALFDVLKVVGLIVLNVAKAIGDTWNELVGAVQSVFRALADISVFGVKPLGFLDGWADSLEGAKADTEAMAQAIAELTGLSYDLALAKAKEAQASYENYNATKKATEALTNVPDRWKRLLRTGEAANPQAPPAPPGSAPPGSTPPGSPGGGGAPPGRGGGLPPVLGNGPIGDVYDRSRDVVNGGMPRPGMGGALGNVWNIVNNLTVNGADKDTVLAEAEQRGYLTGQRVADTSGGSPVRVGPFQLSLG